MSQKTKSHFVNPHQIIPLLTGDIEYEKILKSQIHCEWVKDQKADIQSNISFLQQKIAKIKTESTESYKGLLHSLRGVLDTKIENHEGELIGKIDEIQLGVYVLMCISKVVVAHEIQQLSGDNATFVLIGMQQCNTADVPPYWGQPGEA